MSGLMRRLSRRRSAGPEGTKPPAAAAPGPGDAPASTPAEAEGRTSLLADPAAPTPAAADPDAPTQVVPGATDAGAPTHVVPGAAAWPDPAAQGAAPAPPAGDLPAGLDPDELAAVPTTSARRSRLRRRVAFLRAARELLLRDLGGFVYELHRTAGDVEHEAHRRLRATKLARLSAVDAELHELELRLDDVRRHVVVREPGVGGECPRCGELFGSDAHYCSHCGLALTESARKAVAAAPPDPVAEDPATPPTPTDQATQELPPPEDEGGTEFRWPRRRSGSAAQAAAAGEPAASGDLDGAEATGRGEATTSGASAGGDESGRGYAAQPGGATAGGDDPRRGDAAQPDGVTAGREEPARGDDAGPAVGRGDDAGPVAGEHEAGRGDDAGPVAGEHEAGRGDDAGPVTGGDGLGRSDESGAGDEAVASEGVAGEERDGSAGSRRGPGDAPEDGRGRDVVSRAERGS